MKSYGPYMAMVVIQLAYGGSNILMKLALERGLNQLVFIVYRHIIAMLLLCPFAYVLERKHRPSLDASSTAKIFLLSFLGTTAHLNLYYTGMRYTSPTVASALSNIVPGLTIVIAVLLRMENVKLRSTHGKAKVLGTVACIGGSLLFTFWKGGSIFRGGASAHRHPNIISGDQHEDWIKGTLLIILSFVAWSAWLILQAVVHKIYPARLSLTVLICFFATLQSSLLALFWGRNPDIWKVGWNVQLWTILYCGVVLSALVYYLQTWCISKKGPVFAAMFSPLQLVIVALISAIVFGERLHLGSLIGAVVIVSGLYCVLWGKWAETAEQEANEVTSSQGRGHEERSTDIP